MLYVKLFLEEVVSIYVRNPEYLIVFFSFKCMHPDWMHGFLIITDKSLLELTM